MPMLLELTFNNYRLFKGTNTFSFLADKRTKTLMSNSYQLDNRNVLKTMAIYGPNNSGKSNICSLFKTIKKVTAGDVSFEMNRALFRDAPLTCVKITFNNEDDMGWFSYEFHYDSSSSRFIYEKMASVRYYESNNVQSKTIFEKDYEKKTLYILNEDKSAFLSFVSSKYPFLFAVEMDSPMFKELTKYKKALEDFSSSLIVVNMFNIPIEKTIESLKGSDENKKQFISSFVKNADISIQGFRYNETPVLLKNNDPEILEKTLRDSKDMDMFHLFTKYGDIEVPSILFDSTGTKKVEAVAAYIYDAIKGKKTLIMDEMDNGLHYLITKSIVSTFNNLLNDGAQLLFTAHDLMLIGCKMLLRKDQICFIRRNMVEASVYCLKDATVSEGGPRSGGDLLKRYNAGDFEKLPSPDFMDDLIRIKNERKNHEAKQI